MIKNGKKKHKHQFFPGEFLMLVLIFHAMRGFEMYVQVSYCFR